MTVVVIYDHMETAMELIYGNHLEKLGEVGKKKGILVETEDPTVDRNVTVKVTLRRAQVEIGNL